jgi:HD domain
MTLGALATPQQLREHHEKFDGTGYPKGLAGHEISLAGRLVAVTDVFDVITATRSYKRPMTAQEGRLELTRCAGTHFDPVMVRAFLDISIGRLRKVMGPFSWLAPAATLGRALPGAPGVTAVTAGAAAMTAGIAVGVVPTPLAFADQTHSTPAVEAQTNQPQGADDDPVVVTTAASGVSPTGLAADGSAADGAAVDPDGSLSTPGAGATTPAPPIIVTPEISPAGPPVTVPSTPITVPPIISVEPITVPTLHDDLDPLSAPTLPAVTLPPVTLVPVTLPPVTVPPVTVPLPGL